MAELPAAWSPAARRALPAMRAWRSALHREPELSNQESRTREQIAGFLQELGVPYRTFEQGAGVVGLLGADRRGPVVALRADMDGLPLTEETGATFRSRTPGVMHACGHDVHMAALLGAATVLARSPERLRGPVKLVFQPAEEDGERGGALPLLEQGAFDDPPVDFVVGQHVDPWVPLGKVGWSIGPSMAAADRFRITVHGHGGHASAPQMGPDAVLVAAEIVVGLQAVVSRVVDPADPAVVSVGAIHGGTRHNILPERVVLDGTVRSLRPEVRDLLERTVRRRVQSIARSLGARATIEYRRGYPALVNPAEATRTIVRGLEIELGRENVVGISRPLMGAEDFARYLEKVPGSFLRLGVGVPGKPASLHSATFLPDERALVVGAATLAAAAVALQAPSR